MEQRDRDKIALYCDRIVLKIDMTKLFPKLLEHRIYNPDDVNIPRWKKNLTARNIVEEIFLNIQTRGPKAFHRLLLSLRQSHHEDLADILEEKVHQKSNKDNDKNINILRYVKEIPPFNDEIQQSNEPLKIKLNKATKYSGELDSVISIYPMRSKPRGLVLLITNIEYNLSKEKPRFSAEHDENNLKDLFEQMGFDVITKRNLTGKEIKDAVRKFSRKRELNCVDSCFVIISSHGTEDEMHHTEIQGIDSGQGDYEKVLCTDILDYFTVEACPQLARKPKIFIFQLCRGPRKQNAIRHERFVTDTCAVFPKDTDEELKPDNTVLSDNCSMRNYADMLVVHSTLPGHVAYRDTTTGSWFIQILCKVFMTFACEVHVADLFSIIDVQLQHLRTTGDNCQTSSVQSIGFNRRCYLNPGYFPDQD